VFFSPAFTSRNRPRPSPFLSPRATHALILFLPHFFYEQYPTPFSPPYYSTGASLFFVDEGGGGNPWWPSTVLGFPGSENFSFPELREVCARLLFLHHPPTVSPFHSFPQQRFETYFHFFVSLAGPPSFHRDSSRTPHLSRGRKLLLPTPLASGS